MIIIRISRLNVKKKFPAPSSASSARVHPTLSESGVNREKQQAVNVISTIGKLVTPAGSCSNSLNETCFLLTAVIELKETNIHKLKIDVPKVIKTRLEKSHYLKLLCELGNLN